MNNFIMFDRDDAVDKLFKEFLKNSLEDWEILFKNKKLKGRLQDIESIADAVCTQSAMVGAYMVARGASGCGDSGHEEAIKAVHKVRNRIREALGYNG